MSAADLHLIYGLTVDVVDVRESGGRPALVIGGTHVHVDGDSDLDRLAAIENMGHLIARRAAVMRSDLLMRIAVDR